MGNIIKDIYQGNFSAMERPYDPLSKENIDFLLDLGVKDSKKMSDQEIKKVVPLIIQRSTVNLLHWL